MPAEGPGLRKNNAVATKTTIHGDPAIESNTPGIAFKTKQLGPFVDPTTAAAREIAVGESFVIMIGGKNEVRTAAFDSGSLPAEGARLYIIAATNKLTTTASGNTPFGVVDEVLTTRGLAVVNQNLRDTF